MGVALAERPKVAKEKEERRERLLRLLTYEVVDGRPIYYRGYKDVLEGRKQPEEVMGSSAFHARVLEYVLRRMFGSLSEEEFRIATGEVGVITHTGSRRNLDIALFKASDVREYELTPHYYPVPPLLVVEVDVKADVGNEGDLGYILKKSRELIDFGVKRVVWILTSPRSVLVFELGKPAVILGWEDEVEIWEGVKVRLSDLLKRP